jgi:hypothetical protein
MEVLHGGGFRGLWTLNRGADGVDAGVSVMRRLLVDTFTFLEHIQQSRMIDAHQHAVQMRLAAEC